MNPMIQLLQMRRKPLLNGEWCRLLNEVKSFVKFCSLEFLAQLPRVEPEARGTEGRFVEAIEVKEPKAPASFVAAKRNLTPAFGGFFDLGGHGPGPAGYGVVAAFQYPGT